MSRTQQLDARSQNEKIALWLLAGKSITPLESLERFGCFRLGARIYDLRKEGYDIEREMVKTPQGKHVASYRLAEKS